MNTKMKTVKEARDELLAELDEAEHVHKSVELHIYVKGQLAGFEARDKIAQEREKKLVEALEYYKSGKILFIDGTVNTMVAERALAKLEGDK